MMPGKPRSIGLLLVGLLAAPAVAAEPFAIRGWDIERYDPAYVEQTIRRARDAGMNTISLSHEVVMNAEEILHDWHRYQHLRNFCAEAHRCGMKIFFWNHQINNPPESVVSVDAEGRRSLDFDNPALEQWLYDRYQRVVARVPDLDGIILSLTESEWQVHREGPSGARGGARVVSRLAPAERMARVIRTINRSLRARGKQLIVRDFLRSPAEMDSFSEALRGVPDDVWVFTKCVPNDWQYQYPPHPLLGKVKPHRQIMELDCYNETGGNIRIAMLAPDYYQRQIRLARERGLSGVIARVDDGFRTNQGTAAEFNVFAYSRLLHDPDANVEAMWPAFFTPIYGAEAAPLAIACLKETFDLVCRIRNTLGFWTGTGAPSLSYTDDHLLANSSALWSDDPRFKEIETLLAQSGPEAIRRAVEEKRVAEEMATRCLEQIEAARSRFADRRFAELQGYFEEARRQAQIGQVWARAYFAFRWYRNARSSESRAELMNAVEASRSFVQQEAPSSAYTQNLDERDRKRFQYAGLREFNDQLKKAMGRIAETQPAGK